MSYIVKLSVEDRYNVLKYAHQLPSTLQTFFNFPAFREKLEFSPEDEKELDIKVVDGKITCNKPDLVFEYDLETFPKPILRAINQRVDEIKDEMEQLRKAHKEDKTFKDSPLFTAIVENLGKLVVPDELLKEPEEKTEG